MFIQGSPEILQGPRGLNGQFGSLSAPNTEEQTAALKAEAYARGRAKRNAAHQASLQRLFPGVDTTNANAVNAARAAKVEAKRQEKLRLRAIKDAALAASRAAAVKLEVDADEYAKYLALEANAGAIRAADKKVINDAWTVANRAAVNFENATVFEDQLAKASLRERALTDIKALYLEVLGREGDAAGLKYFADRFGDVLDPDELQIFRDMAQPEIDARNQYIAEMAAKSAQDAAQAVADAAAAQAEAAAAAAAATRATAAAAAVQAAIAEQVKIDSIAEQVKIDSIAEQVKIDSIADSDRGSGGINPMLILAAAAAAFFIGS